MKKKIQKKNFQKLKNLKWQQNKQEPKSKLFNNKNKKLKLQQQI